MKLIEGRTYRTREGDPVMVTLRRPPKVMNNDFPYVGNVHRPTGVVLSCSWTPDGQYTTSGLEHIKDLVEEVQVPKSVTGITLTKIMSYCSVVTMDDRTIYNVQSGLMHWSTETGLLAVFDPDGVTPGCWFKPDYQPYLYGGTSEIVDMQGRGHRFAFSVTVPLDAFHLQSIALRA
jgi:hypothetical protein